jgi:enoyl-CoA hydratase/carnithine racemase
MIDELIAAGESLMNDKKVRAVVLSGDGKAFCSGLDVASFGALAGGNPADILVPRTHGNANRFQQIVMVWQKLPVPVIAALQGATYGGGLQIALGADIRIAAPDTQVSVLEMKWGIIPDLGGMALMPRLTRSDVIRRMTYTADSFGAEQALAWGLVTEISDDPLSAAMDLAGTIARKSPSAIRAAKAMIGYAEEHGADTDAILQEESRLQSTLIGRADQMEVIAANLQKRAPVFK